MTIIELSRTQQLTNRTTPIKLRNEPDGLTLPAQSDTWASASGQPIADVDVVLAGSCSLY